jgi:hypothetical protein
MNGQGDRGRRYALSQGGSGILMQTSNPTTPFPGVPTDSGGVPRSELEKGAILAPTVCSIRWLAPVAAVVAYQRLARPAVLDIRRR